MIKYQWGGKVHRQKRSELSKEITAYLVFNTDFPILKADMRLGPFHLQPAPATVCTENRIPERLCIMPGAQLARLKLPHPTRNFRTSLNRVLLIQCKFLPEQSASLLVQPSQ